MREARCAIAYTARTMKILFGALHLLGSLFVLGGLIASAPLAAVGVAQLAVLYAIAFRDLLFG